MQPLGELHIIIVNSDGLKIDRIASGGSFRVWRVNRHLNCLCISSSNVIVVFRQHNDTFKRHPKLNVHTGDQPMSIVGLQRPPGRRHSESSGIAGVWALLNMAESDGSVLPHLT